MNPVCTSDTWGPVFIETEEPYWLVCDLARYRSAEPVKPMMICPDVAHCSNHYCRGSAQHAHGPFCGTYRKNGGCIQKSGPCVPVPPAPSLTDAFAELAKVAGPYYKNWKPEPAPVREIDRGAIQWHIDNVRELYAPYDTTGTSLKFVTDTLEALADGKARVRRRELVSGASPVIFASQEAFDEAAADRCRDLGWKEPS